MSMPAENKYNNRGHIGEYLDIASVNHLDVGSTATLLFYTVFFAYMNSSGPLRDTIVIGKGMVEVRVR